MVHSHRCSAEEGTSAPLLPETAEEVWNEPQHPQILLHLHCGELLTGCITAWFGNSTAGNRKALQRVVRTARHIVGGELPSLQDIYTRRLYKESQEDHQGLQPSIPQTALSVALRETSPQHPIRTSRLRDSFFPQAIRQMNVRNNSPYITLPLTHHAMHCTLPPFTGLHAHTAIIQPICYHWITYNAHPRHCIRIIRCTLHNYLLHN